MNLEILKDLDGNHFHIAVASHDQIEDLRYDALEDTGTHAARVLRGMAMTTIEDFHHEVAVAFQFPYYYGHNSSAYLDVMKDLSWLKRERYTMIILDAHLLLSQEDDLTKQYILQDFWAIGDFWSKEVDEPYRKPFKYIFQVDQEHVTTIRSLLELLNNV